MLAIVLLARVYRERERPSSTIAWVLAIVLMPYVGVPAYLLFGGRKMRRLLATKDWLNVSADETERPMISATEHLLRGSGVTPASFGCNLTFQPDGRSAYKALIDMMEGAERSLDVQTFIIGRDEVGRAVVETLARRAREGVRVRLLLDAFGCIWTHRGFVDPVREAGGEVAVFLPVLPLGRKWSANLRNHRKIVIADDNRALIGGMNLTKEYMGERTDPKRWIDTMAVVEGGVIKEMRRIFDEDWFFAGGTPLDLDIALNGYEEEGGSILQVVPSGPDVQGDPLYEAMLNAIHRAERSVVLITPYFVPDNALTRALRMQARLGRRVELIMPRKSNHRIADFARGAILRRLQDAGVKVYLHPLRMIHAKHVIVDDDLAVLGSPNFDMRSFYLNFELALFTYSPRDIVVLHEWAESLKSECIPVQRLEAGYWRRWAEDVSWLVSPLL